MVLLTKSEAAAPPNFRRTLAWCVPLGALCLVLAVGELLINPAAVVTAYRMQMTIGSEVEAYFKKPIYPVVLSAWLFNITNAASFEAGQDPRLKVEKVGPFTYKETRYNENFSIDPAAGVAHYSARSCVHFSREESVAGADDVTVTMPNLAMLGISTLMSRQSYWTKMGFNVLVSQLGSQPTVTTNASTYLWGYSDPILSLVHTLIPGYISFEKMGVLDQFFNGTFNLEMSSRDEDRFMLKSRNGLKKLPMGASVNVEDCKICDDFSNAYEGLGFPSFITPETPIRIYKNGLCKILPTVFHKKVTYDSGVEGLYFNLSDSFFSLDPNVSSNMMLDISSCFYGIPLAVSKAHFLDVDPKLYERIEGVPQLDPTAQSYFIIEPTIAMELESVVRVQLNMVLPDLSFSSRARSYSGLVVPIAYMEFIQPPLPEDVKNNLHMIYVIAPVLTWAVIGLLATIGLALISYPVILYFVHKYLKNDKKITVLTTQEPLLHSQIQDGCKQKS